MGFRLSLHRPATRKQNEKVSYLGKGKEKCYFSEKEYQRLMKEYEEHQSAGEPREGAYVEAISGGEEHSVILEFEAIAQIKISTESQR